MAVMLEKSIIKEHQPTEIDMGDNLQQSRRVSLSLRVKAEFPS